LEKVIIKNTDSIEYDIFNIAKTYSVWREVGSNRMERMENIMWHDCWKDEEYTKALKEYLPKYGKIPLVPNVEIVQLSIPRFL
jgi:hypothetical protein